MRRKLRAALSLSWQDWRVLLQAWFLLLAIDGALRCRPFQQVASWAARGRAPRPSDPRSLDAQRFARLVVIAARHHLYPMLCLRQALVLQYLLHRRGLLAELRIGVRRDGDALQAHAWLEWNGEPIGEPRGVSQEYALLQPKFDLEENAPAAGTEMQSDSRLRSEGYVLHS